MQRNTLYDIYVVARDNVLPTPNLQPTAQQRVLNTTAGAAAPFVCSSSKFTSSLRPSITSTGAGLPVGDFYRANGTQ